MSAQSRKSRFLLPALCALAGLSFSACAADSDEGSEGSSNEPEPLAEVQVGETRVSFFELAPGAVFTLSRGAPGESPLKDPALRELNSVQLYEHLTKQAAPAALREAHDRSLALAHEAASAGATSEPEPEELNVAEPEHDGSHDKLLDAEFRAKYCSLGMQKCLIYVTGDRSYENSTRQIYGAVNPFYGNVKLQLRTRDWSGWHNLPGGEFTVYQDEEVYYESSPVPILARPFRASIKEASNDIYNWAHGW